MNMRDSLKKSGRDMSSLKTCRGCSPQGLRQSCRIWPRAGMMRSGKCFPRPRSAPRIGASGFSLLPTPTVMGVTQSMGFYLRSVETWEKATNLGAWLLGWEYGLTGRAARPSGKHMVDAFRARRASIREAYGGCVLRRVDDGSPARLDGPAGVRPLPRELVPVWVRRLKALGNAITPQQAYAVAACIMRAEGLPVPERPDR